MSKIWLLMTAAAVASCASPAEPPIAELRAGAPDAPWVHASSVRIPIDWHLLRPLDPPAAESFLFVHLLDQEGQLLRTFDRRLPEARTESDDVIEI